MAKQKRNKRNQVQFVSNQFFFFISFFLFPSFSFKSDRIRINKKKQKQSFRQESVYKKCYIGCENIFEQMEKKNKTLPLVNKYECPLSCFSNPKG